MLGNYEIQSRLGAGGMGEVYLARDIRLDRLVALKVLPEAFALDEQKLRRFKQEARLTSALKHPNIGHIYEVGETTGTHYLAMEYVEGPTLRARLASGPLPIDELLELGLQAADALAEAHEAGILHRDIKSDNFMIDRRGQLKVLDFGLARIAENPVPESDETRTQAITNVGMVVGTPQSMSPEQVLGRRLDPRSDLFSLGVVLYQMATGALPFHGKTSPEVMDAIVHYAVTPPLRLNPSLPPDLERIILRALEKDPAMRYQTASDLRADLKRLKRDTESGPQSTRSTAQGPARPSRKRWIAVAAVAMIAVAGVFVWVRSRPMATASEAAEITTRPFLTSPTDERHAVFSPDGKMVAYDWGGEEGVKPDIYVKLLDAGNPLRLTTAPGENVFPTWSPDGRFLAFERIVGNRMGIFTVPALGGVERRLLDVPVTQTEQTRYSTIAWHPDGKAIAFASVPKSEPAGIFLLDIDSGQRRRLTTVPGQMLADFSPVFSPDGKTLAFLRFRTTVTTDIMLLSMSEGTVRSLNREEWISSLAWMPDGRSLLFAAGSRDAPHLYRISKDTGEAAAITAAGAGVMFASPSPDGRRIVYQQSVSDTNVWHLPLTSPTKAGTPAVWIASTRREGDPRYSPEGQRILFLSNRSGRSELWLADADGKNAQQLTTGSPIFGSPRWSPDATHIVFDGRIHGNAEIFVMPASGGNAQRLTDDPAEDIVPSWSHDGRWIYFCSNRSGSQQIWRMPSSGGSAEQVTQTGGFDSQESVDGKYLYFTRGRDRPGLLRRTPDGREEMLLPELRQRMWSVAPGGIYFVDPNAKKREIRYFDLATHAISPVAVLSKPLLFTNRSIDVSPDGRNLLWLQVDSSNSDIMLLENYR